MDLETIVNEYFSANESNNIKNPLLKAEVEKLRASETSEIVGLAVGCLRVSSQTIDNVLTTLREYRRMAKSQLTTIKNVGDAKNFLEETGNPFPLCKALGDTNTARALLNKIGKQFRNWEDPIFKIPKNAKRK